MGRVFLLLALVATGLLLWRSGRLDFILHSDQTPLERKAEACLAEGGWDDATIEQREKDLLVHIPLGRDSDRWQAADEGRRACTHVAETLGGEHNVTVMVLGPPAANGYAPVYGCADYSTSSHRVSWQPYN